MWLSYEFHDRLDGLRRRRQREELVSNIPLVADFLDSLVYPREVDLAGAGLMTSRSVRDVNVSEGVSVVFDRVADAAFVDLHMIHIV